MNSFTFIDLFCGIGGFHIAMEQLGGTCVFASEIDKNAQDVYEKNFKLRPEGDITKIEEKEIPKHDVLCAGFPCQAFSKAGFQNGLKDTRGTLFFDIMRIVKFHKPKYLVLENVRNLVGHDNGRTWKIISENLTNEGYLFQDPPIIFSPHQIGIPQFRERVVILCKRKDLGPNKINLNLPPKKECLVDNILQSDDEISNIEDYKLNETEVEIINIWDEFIKGITTKKLGFPIWADEFGKDYPIQELPKWQQTFIIKNRDLYSKNKEFIDSWLEKYNHLEHLKPSRRKFEWQAQDSERDLWKLILQLRPSGLRVKRPTHFPALVAITQTSIIGSRKRRLTPREVARLQSFPDNFKYANTDKAAYKQFGNAVNVEVIKFLAEKLFNQKNEISSKNNDLNKNKANNLLDWI